ncbi:hypothetical protein NSQ96_01540 [Caldifermentibacillus hisashii]|uniref:hypothetical protein n=1 Tax=Caldifermentibacillus hisashii TaxID=996558 RepID=UPI0031FE14A3
MDGNRDFRALQGKTGFENTIIWNKFYNFQIDGVVRAINKIETYGGCIIADSVGLGKTFEALAVHEAAEELLNYMHYSIRKQTKEEKWSIIKNYLFGVNLSFLISFNPYNTTNQIKFQQLL